MSVYNKKLILQSDGRRPIHHNITKEVREFVKETGIKNGILAVVSPHTTCAVDFEEMVHDVDVYGDDFLSVDLDQVMDSIIPVHTRENQYNYPGPEHYAFADSLGVGTRWDCLNGDSHLRSSIIGNSKVFSIIDGEIQLGQFGYVYFIDWDQRSPHNRTCIMQIIGE